MKRPILGLFIRPNLIDPVGTSFLSFTSQKATLKDRSYLSHISKLFQSTLAINILLALLGIILFLPRLHLELKLDELGSYWVIKDTFYDTVERSLHLGQSPLYYSLLWISYKFLGASELALRFPSIVLTILSSILMVKLGTLLFRRDVGIFAAIAFISSIQAIVAATDARPYALGIFLTIASSIALIKWADSFLRSWLIFYCILLGCTVHSHYLFAVIIPVHLIWLICHERPLLKEMFMRAPLACGVLVLILAPVAYHVSLLSYQTSGKSFVRRPGIDDLAFSLLPSESLILVILLLVVRIIVVRKPERQVPIFPKVVLTKRELLNVLIFLFLPVIFNYCISVISSNSIFLERYYGQRVLGLALLGGLLISSLQITKHRIAISFALLFVIGVNQYSYGFSEMAGDGFGKAAKRLSSEDPLGQCQVLAMSGFIEAQTIDWLSDDRTRQFILSPFSYYQVSNPILPIPYSLDTNSAKEYYGKVVRTSIDKASCVWILYRNGALFVDDQQLKPAPLTIESDLLGELGFQQGVKTVHGFVELINYPRHKGSPLGHQSN